MVIDNKKNWRVGGLWALCAVLAGCGGGQGPAAEDAASAAGTEGRMRILAATSTLPIKVANDADPLMQGLAIPADAPTRGMWSATQPWPMNALHAVLLPSGKVLSYGTPQNTPGTQDGRTTDVWSPSQGWVTASHVTSFDAGRVDSFCSTAAWLPDGRLMVTGGNSPLNSGLVNADSATSVTDTYALADQRWYATMLALPDGRSVMLGGMDPYSEGMEGAPDAAIANGTVSMTPEIYTPGSGWRSLAGARSRDAFGPDYLRTSYPRAWVAADGRVFGISAETMWWLDVNGNNGTGLITLAGKFKTAPSATAPVNVGATNSAVMYAPGKVLVVGGNGGFNGDGRPASDMATSVDFNGATPVLTEAPRMSTPRRFPNTVVLPDGKVLVTGGTKVGNNGGADAVYAAEIWNPATNTWSPGASAAQIRVYHSATLLLANGAVLSTGGGAPGPVDNQNSELYYPPYLFRTVNGVAQLAPRPVITGISALKFAAGDTITLEMTDATAMARVVLVGNGTVTHSFNSTQRHVPLAYTQSGDRIAASLPANANLVPPGYYQLYVLDAQGVPSRGVIVAIGTKAPTAPVTLTRGQTLAFDSVSAAGNAIGTDANGLGVLQAATAANTPTTARFIVRDGLANAACVSLEAASATGRYLRHAGYRLQLGTPDGSDLFKNDATFCPEAGVGGSGISLRSVNYPTYLLRHRNGEIWIDPQAADAAYTGSASWLPRDPATVTLPTIGAVAAAPLASGGTASYNPGLDAAGLTFSWNFGDGTPATAYSASSATTHAYANPGLYLVTLTARTTDGRTTTKTFLQAVYRAPTANAPRASTAVLLEPRTNASARLWVVNADNDSVSVIDTATNARVAEIATGAAPRTLARAADGSIWVANRDGASISVINPATLAVVRTTALPRASQPWGLVIAADGNAYVSLQATGQVLKLNGSTGATLATLAVGANPRHLSVTGDSSRLLVSRFITPPLPGEGTATVTTTGVGGEVLAVNTATMTVQSTVRLAHSDRADTEIQGSGIPNYLGAAVISPDGTQAWVPSKQDNVKRGGLRNGLPLDFQNTVRAISSRINLGTLAEDAAARVDHDNASLASAAAYDPTGSYLFVALETSRQVEVVSAVTGARLFRIETDLAPQGVAVSADGRRLYVLNALARNVGVVDISPLTASGETRSVAVATVGAIATEKLAANVLKGKQLFHDARDTRLSRDSYMSCASCHNEGGHDGRTWDLTSLGEGLRNTPSLRGRAGMGQGFAHWSANFDEIQDFEGQIRALAGGTGLMTDAQFNTGTRNQPLGDAKAGVSADLDALAAYVGSLAQFAPSPWRNADGTLGAAAAAGKTLFQQKNCGSCHGGSGFTISAGAAQLQNVGTIKTSSGKRLGGTLTGIDVPTLRDVWATAPYLHDGSAATLEAAMTAHNNLTLTATEVASLAEYLRQIGSEEPAPAVPTGTGAGLRGDYFASVALGGAVRLTRTEAVNFDWGTAAPGTNVPADNFSVRWSGYVEAPASGAYQFQTNSDDGVRVWVNGALVINNWTDHGPTIDTSAAINLVGGQRYAITVEYYERGGGATMQLRWKEPAAAAFVAVPASRLYTTSPAAASGLGLQAEYYGGTALAGAVLLTRPEAINFDWGTAAPATGVPADNFSVRWTGFVEAGAAGSYQFQTLSDDGVRVWVNGVLVIDNWTVHSPTTNTSAAITLAANQRVSIRVEYFDNLYGATVKLLWKEPGATGFVAVPSNRLYLP